MNGIVKAEMSLEREFGEWGEKTRWLEGVVIESEVEDGVLMHVRAFWDDRPIQLNWAEMDEAESKLWAVVKATP